MGDEVIKKYIIKAIKSKNCIFSRYGTYYNHLLYCKKRLTFTINLSYFNREVLIYIYNSYHEFDGFILRKKIKLTLK